MHYNWTSYSYSKEYDFPPVFNYKLSLESSMQQQPTIQAWFCIQIKAFNYTQCSDKMALPSCSVDARMETLRKTWLFITPRLLNECVISKVHANPLPVHRSSFCLVSKKHEEEAALFSPHLGTTWCTAWSGVDTYIKCPSQTAALTIMPLRGHFHIIYDVIIKLVRIKNMFALLMSLCSRDFEWQ